MIETAIKYFLAEMQNKLKKLQNQFWQLRYLLKREREPIELDFAILEIKKLNSFPIDATLPFSCNWLQQESSKPNIQWLNCSSLKFALTNGPFFVLVD